MSSSEFDIITIGGRTTLHLDSDRLDQCLAYAKSHDIDRVAINAVRGYKLRDLEFLRRYTDIAELEIVFPPSPPFDISAIYCLKVLRLLSLSEPVVIVLKRFSSLEVFRGIWCAGLDLSGCERLSQLRLSKYDGGKSRDLTGLPDMSQLVDLALVQARLSSLKGLGRFAGLRRLELAYMPKLLGLDGLSVLARLEVLECQNCPKLQDYPSVVGLPRLRSLRFNACGEIPTLRFLDELPDLEEFRFVNTNVADGDLRPLLRLKSVGFLPRKHYSHTPEELDAILRPKGGGAVPRVE